VTQGPEKDERIKQATGRPAPQLPERAVRAPQRTGEPAVQSGSSWDATDEYRKALIAEIRILIRAISGDPGKDLSQLKVDWRDKDQPLRYPDVVELISSTPASKKEQLEQLGLLHVIRDALTRMTNPATGYSIAYTNLVIGNEFKQNSEGTYDLATRAYGGLSLMATMHRWFIRVLVLIAVIMAIFGSWEATKATLGRSLLQALQPLREQQTTLAKDKYKLDTELASLQTGSPGSAQVPLTAAVAVCSKYKEARDAHTDLNVPKEKLAEVLDVCGRDQILLKNFEIAHGELNSYLCDWPGMVGGLYAPIGRAAGAVLSTLHLRGASGCAQTATDDVEFRVAPIVQVVTTYILPFTFGVIGSLLYVLLQHYQNLRSNLLIPRDHVLGYLRVALGIVVAASVSMLITSASGPTAPTAPPLSGSTAPDSLVGSLTLTTSLITFLAGFGAEAVFTLLQNLVDRVFSLPDRK
jgi:hypothetical protein